MSQGNPQGGTGAEPGPAPAEPQVPPPPTGFKRLGPPDSTTAFDSFEAGESYLYNWSRQYGFHFTKGTGSKERGDVHYHCHLGIRDTRRFQKRAEAAELSLNARADTENFDESQQDENVPKKRKRTTAKTGCPFKISLKYRIKDRLWHLNIPPRKAFHNHGKCQAITMPAVRALEAEHIKLIKRSMLTSLTPSQIMTTLASEYPGRPFLRQDVYNAINKINCSELNGRTSSQVCGDNPLFKLYEELLIT